MLKYLYFRSGDLLLWGARSRARWGYEIQRDRSELLETLKRQHYVGVKKSLGIGNSSGVFALTESGRSLTREYLENNLYAGHPRRQCLCINTRKWSSARSCATTG